MYVGRIVAAGCTRSGRNTGLYRVSSRSFPNRHAVPDSNSAAIVPKPGHETDVQKSPYIAYNCLRVVGTKAIVTNGAHTDPIAEKVEAGMPDRDALVQVLLTMDYEKDKYNTPRIAAIVDAGSAVAFLGIVRHDAVLVRAYELQPGTFYYVCTYERNGLDSDDMDTGVAFDSAEQGCDYILGQGVFAQFEKPVSAVAAVAGGQAGAPFEIAAKEA